MNNLAIFTKTLMERKKSTLIWSLALFGFAMLFAGLHNSFASDIDEIVDIYPEDLQAFVGDISGAADPAGWLGLQLYNIFLPIVVGAIGISFGASAIGKEEDSGTLELLLASPVSRAKILFQKTLALEVQLALVAGALWSGVALGTLLFEFDVSLTKVFWATFMGWLMGAFYGYLTLGVQGATGRRVLASSFGTAFLVYGYFADALANLFDWLNFLKYSSPFYYYDGPGVLLDGPNLTNISVLVGAILFFYAIAHYRFTRRDTAV